MHKKEIGEEEHRRILIKMLKYFDELCRKYGIQYSLIGGSLIGAIRHKGFVPWDDDIDVILTRDNYVKLKKKLEKESGRYQLLDQKGTGKCFGFMKLVDTKTRLIEVLHPNFGDDYGIFIDILCYYPTAEQKKERLKHYNEIKLTKSLFLRYKLNLKNRSLLQNLKWFCKNTASRLLGYRCINRLSKKVLNRYVGSESRYVVSNWPAYGFEKEIQLQKNTEEYIDTVFEGLKVMVFKNYDEILRTTFGDYMQLPPESERVPKHDTTAWWKEDLCRKGGSK